MDRPLDIFADEEPTEIHHQDCEDTPESYATGDAIAEMAYNPDEYARESEQFDVSCSCLDQYLGSDR